MAGEIFAEESRELKRFDLVIGEQFTHNALVTDNPVDNRSPVSDHIQEGLLTITAKLQVTESPFQDRLTSESFLSLSGPRAVIAWKWMTERRYLQTFSYTSARFGVIEQLALEGLEWDVSANLHTVFTLSFKRIRFAYSSTVLLPPERRKKTSQVPNVDEGIKDTKSSDDVLELFDDSFITDIWQKANADPNLRGPALFNQGF